MSIIDHTIQVHVPDSISDKKLQEIDRKYTSLGLHYVIVKVEARYFGQEVKAVCYDELASRPKDGDE